MPWKETTPMDQRVKFVAQYQQGEVSFALLCRQFGISRKTGYKWVERYELGSVEGLKEQSRAPQHHPQAISPEMEELIRAARAKYPTWGPKKLVVYLKQEHPEQSFPAPSTVGDALRRAGLVVARPHRRHAPARTAPLSHAEQPNQVWSIDFKGNFPVGDGQQCYPLTLTDNASRYLLRCQVLTKTATEVVQPIMEATFREYGLPVAIRSDNGPPFASVGLGGLSRLSVWWVKLGITPERIQPGHPEENGRHERMHRTLKEETASPPEATVRAQQGASDRFEHIYNWERPHEALGQQTPGSVYLPSGRKHPDRLPLLEYLEADRVLRVRTSGEVYLKKQYIYLTAALAGEPVGLTLLEPGRWQLQFGPLVIGVLDERTGKVLPVKRSEGKGEEAGRTEETETKTELS